MVNSTVAMDDVFHALASEARRGMLGRLAHGELTVGQLGEPLDMSLAAASKHVQVLERAGLVTRRIEGRRHICRLDARPLASAHAWLRFYERFWSDRIDALEALLQADHADRQEQQP
jgi:DNA-binding transcriptional ArsR family regulator